MSEKTKITKIIISFLNSISVFKFLKHARDLWG